MSLPMAMEPESTTHSFVIKIWPSGVPEEADQGAWQGRITHVPSGKSGPLEELNEIAEFISPFLESMGVRPTIRVRMSRWAQQLRGQTQE